MGPEHILICVVVAALVFYVLLGGADFGGGVWEFNSAFQASENERRLVARAIGPVWEANHVWLLFVVMLLFNGFPTAFAALSRALWLPLLLALMGIVFRGAAFAFRSYAVGAVGQQRAWQAVFAIGSTAAPFFMGACLGAVASGTLPIDEEGQFHGNYFTSWISPLAIFSAFFAVGTCAYLSAFYLTREAARGGDVQLVALWRQRALSTGIWMGVLALVGLAILHTEVPGLWHGFRTRGWPLMFGSFGCGVLSLVAMWRHWIGAAMLGAATTVTTVMLGWGVSQYPAIVPPTITVASAAAPDNVLWLMIYGTLGGLSVLVPSLVWLMVLFKTSLVEEPSEGQK